MKDNQMHALKMLLLTAIDVFQDINLADIEGKNRVTNKKLLKIIKVLEEK